MFHKRVVFANSFSAQADHDRRLNKSCYSKLKRLSFMLILSCIFYAFVRVCLLMPCGYLLENG